MIEMPYGLAFTNERKNFERNIWRTLKVIKKVIRIVKYKMPKPLILLGFQHKFRTAGSGT